MSASILPSAFVRLLSIVVFLTTFAPVVNGEAWAYKLRVNKTGEVLVWSSQVIKLEINTSNVPQVGGAADAVRAGVLTWTSNGVPHKVNFKETQQSSVSSDKRNVVQWVGSDWKYGKEVVGMTVTMYKQSSGTVTETDIVLNARDHSWAVDPAPGSGHYDIQNVVAHEAGHLFGMGHSTVQDSTMFATTPVEETAKRSLDADDLAGIAALIQEINSRKPAKADNPEPMVTAIEKQTSPLPAREAIGCSVGGESSPGPWWVVLIALAGLALLRSGRRCRRCRRYALLAAALLLVAPQAARATVVKQLTLTQLTGRATAAVKGVVLDARSYRERGMIYTDYTVKVSRCYRGACAGTAILHTIGGQVGDDVVAVEGTPRPRVGQTIYLLGRRSGVKIVSIGMSQGLFRLDPKQPGTLVRDLRGLDLVAGRVRAQGRVERVLKRDVEALLGAGKAPLTQ